MSLNKKIISFMLIVLFIPALFLSCKINEEDGKTDGFNKNDVDASGNADNVEEPKPIPENLIFSSRIFPTIICNNKNDFSEEIDLLGMSVYYTTYARPRIFTDENVADEHEIVIGEANREVSKTAYTLLETLEHKDGEVSYLIYSNGSSVALAFENDRYRTNRAAKLGFEKLEELFDGSSEIIVPKGIVASYSFDALEYQAELDDKADELKWDYFVSTVNASGADGEAIAGAIKEYYNQICTDDLIDWFAGLYDPYIGGYYFSNDARDNRGYLPDIESTGQAIGFFETSGMLNGVEDDGSVTAGFYNYILGLPEWFRNQIVAYLKGLQDPESGFFYHPQWTKEMVDAKLSRRARDLGSAEGTLRYFGSKPTYDTPNGTKGDGILWDGSSVEDIQAVSYLTGRLAYRNSVTAVSRVVSIAAYAEHLESDVTFRAYLLDLEKQHESGARSFYWIGNWIGSQEAQIIERDKQLAAAGADYKLGDILIEWYTKHQNKETGLWDKGLTYENTNALLKIGGTYTKFGYVFPNADKALDSCLKMTMTDEEAEAVVQVYNVWYAIRNLMDNLRKLSTSEEELEKAAAIRKQLLLGAPEAIKLSMEKQLKFKKADGGFSYVANENCVTSQGLPVAPSGDGEGDINATCIVASGTINNCLYALGLKSITPSYFSTADRLRYIALLEDKAPIVKNDIDKRTGGGGITPGKYFTDYGDASLNFNNRELSDTSIYTNAYGTRANASLVPVSSGNHALLITKDGVNTNGKPAVWAKVADKAEGEGNCLVVEFNAKISGCASFNENEYRTVEGGITHFYTTAMNIAFGTVDASEMKYYDWKTPEDFVLDTQIYMSDDTRYEQGAFTGGTALDFDGWVGGGSQFELDRWYNICIEFYELDTEGKQIGVKFYLDGVNVANVTKSSYTVTENGENKPSDAKSVRIDIMDRFVPSEIYIDDLFAGVISKEYKN